MKRKLVAFIFFLVSICFLSCTDEVVPTEVSLDTELKIELDDQKSTDDEEHPEGKHPELG